jgi:hypothetical protein
MLCLATIMAAASILHVGEDPYNRILVMESAGLMVRRSACTVENVQEALQGSGISAVAFSPQERTPILPVVDVARSLTRAPLVLFSDPRVTLEEKYFDLVITPPTSPPKWLKSLTAAMKDARHVRSLSQQLRHDSARARDATRELCAELEKTRNEPEWSGCTNVTQMCWVAVCKTPECREQLYVGPASDPRFVSILCCDNCDETYAYAPFELDLGPGPAHGDDSP